jgi:hypothetical protein
MFVEDHGAEFQDAKGTLVAADADLAEEDRTALVDPYGGGDAGEQWRKKEQEEKGAGDFDQPLSLQSAWHWLMNSE